ncbi:hypothetical protein ACMD2_20623 [Ananas comosus]|uniref:Uncharacterized protein n=1 Tax=Ananas comosus TaxID=4615 RepID=A0A199UER4_ANACO|nr:hypothetical protein ACMD2_20623 [Ananas comosus]
MARRRELTQKRRSQYIIPEKIAGSSSRTRSMMSPHMWRNTQVVMLY